MAVKCITWTEVLDAAILQGRTNLRHSWDHIAREIGISPSAVKEHGMTILGLPGSLPQEPENTELKPSDIRLSPYKTALRHGRPDTADPLPAGHPYAWAVITAGTSLQGETYQTSR